MLTRKGSVNAGGKDVIKRKWTHEPYGIPDEDDE